jgi:uncharacterized membrane protein
MLNYGRARAGVAFGVGVFFGKGEFLFLFFLPMLIYNALNIKGLVFAKDYFMENVGICH